MEITQQNHQDTFVAVVLTNDYFMQERIIFDWVGDHKGTYCITSQAYHLQVSPFGKLIIFEMQH